MVRFQRRKILASCLCMTATVFLLITLQVVVELGKFERKTFKNSNLQDGHKNSEEESKHLNPFFKKEALTLTRKKKLEIENPIMLWWSPLTGETGRLGQCGADACFFTINRTYWHHPMTKAFLFYVFSHGNKRMKEGAKVDGGLTAFLRLTLNIGKESEK